MAPLGELFALSIYVVQQAGILFGVGAETILLSLYLLRVAKPSQPHEHSVRALQWVGLGLIVLSGLGAVVMHTAAGQAEVLLAPAFIFKWVMIAAVLALSSLGSKVAHLHLFAQGTLRGVEGAQWYALLIVHAMAPVVGWTYLLLLYAAWVAVFVLGWMGFLYTMMPKQALSVAKQVVASAPGPAPKPAVPPPPKPAPASSPTPAPAPVPKPASPPAPKVVPPSPPHVAPGPAPTFVPKVPLLVSVHKVLPPPPQPAPAPKPVAAVAAPAPKPPAFSAAPTPAPKPPPYKEEYPTVPALRVMPRTPEEIEGQGRGAVVEFD